VAARGAGLLETRSPGGAQRLTVGVFPAPPELGRAGAGPALAGLADRLPPAGASSPPAPAPPHASSMTCG
jgi:hypothetical protein